MTDDGDVGIVREFVAELVLYRIDCTKLSFGSQLMSIGNATNVVFMNY